MSIDERALDELIEQSEDLQSDAMRTTKDSLIEMVERGQERRAQGGIDPDETATFSRARDENIRTSLAGKGAFAALGFGAALLALYDSPAFAQAGSDVQIMQTAASLENLAVATYDTALGLDFIGGGSAIPVVRSFVMRTKDQHQAHADAFNAAAKNLNGQEQKEPDPVLLDTVNQAKPTLTSAAPVVELAIDLETTAAQTYVANTSALADEGARKAVASVMGVEAQHAAILMAVKALVGANLTDQIALPPPNLARLPEAAGSAGFPDTFYKTDKSRPAEEGSVK